MTTIGALALCVIAYMIIGMLWYSPVLFGNIWSKLTGMGPDKVEKDHMMKLYGFSAMSSFVMASVLNYVMAEVEIQDIRQALFLGFMLWFGFVFTSTLVNNLFQGKSKKLLFIDSGYYLANALAMSTILFFLLYQ